MIYQVFAGDFYYPSSFDDYICNAYSLDNAKHKLKEHINKLDARTEPDWYEIILVMEDVSILVEKGKIRNKILYDEL